ncbi:hypothetical protein [Achromobacter xylosoxidans]|uniref:hypothetical protein n=1 Tax=Alcaligenes xylosoxydans xylosoxydans TaxID=85698 RepID=UPI0006C0D7C8|nr:hypothetical protein [Achromobacter xylosoxidans]CUI30259.1 Uncharacterised protein [Achromobacter xylosoxidans]
MSFHLNLARLRDAAATRTRGEAPDSCRVLREDLHAVLYVVDRMAADQPAPAAEPRLQAAAARLTKLAQETRAIYGQETCAGGEPAYPSWTDDVFALVAAAAPASPVSTVEQAQDGTEDSIALDKLADYIADNWPDRKYSLAEICQRLHATWPTAFMPAAPAAGDAQLPNIDVEAAAKALAECMDYPWAHMPEQGRAHMREHAQSVIRAGLSAAQRQGDA